MRPLSPALPLVLIVSLALASSGCTRVFSVDVESAQKISDTSGNFDDSLDAGDRFGGAVANIGDLEVDGVTDLAVGAPYTDGSGDGSDRGAVWVLFMDQDGRVDVKQRIVDEDEGGFTGELDDGDRFGGAVSALGDLDEDGFLDIAVGAPLDDDGGTDRGAVWVLSLNMDGTVARSQKVSAEAGGLTGELDDSDQFGYALATLGDLNGDGVVELAVGAPADDDDGTDRGAVWVLFMNADGTVSAEQKISSSEGDLDATLDNGDRFGSALADLGDLDGDGIPDLAVGATGDDDGGSDRGAVWILFLNEDGTVDATQKISSTSGDFEGELANGDQFGRAVARIGNLNDDGPDDLAVGAHQDDDGGNGRGAVWILFMSDEGKVVSASKFSDTEGKFDGTLDDGDRFGGAIAGIGDLDGDGRLDLAVGADGDDDGTTDAGAVWILFLGEVESEFEE